MLELSLRLSLPKSVFEINLIIPNQELSFKPLSQLKSDFNDITKLYGSPNELKKLYNIMKQAEEDLKH